MTETENICQNFVPLSRVVNAAIVDMWEDAGRVTQLYSHWAARGLLRENMQILKSGKRSVFIPVNRNTNTATLPPDFNGEIFVGIVDNGIKHSLRLDTSLADLKNIVDIPCEDKCTKCNTNKAICEDFTVTVDTTIVVINAANYDQTITKKLYPNGDYYLESSIPFLDIDTNTVIYRTSKEFIAHIDLAPCGCIEETESNLETVRVCNPDVYYNYYSPCGCSKPELGGYQIFEESGLIQFSPNFGYDKVYLEYRASMLKINGQYQVPKIAFETLVEWTKHKAVQNKKNVSRLEKNDQWNHYLIEKGNLRILKTRTSLSNLIDALHTTPKFDIYVSDYSSCSTTAQVIESVPTNICDTDNSSSGGSGGSGGGTVVTEGYVPFSFGVIVGVPGAPINNTSSWQSDSLKGALNLNSFILDNTNYTIVAGDFTFDSTTGTIYLTSNKFFDGMAMTGIYFKKV